MSKEEEKKNDDDVGGLDDETEVELQLKSQDMLTFKVNKDVVMQSALIKTMWSGLVFYLFTFCLSFHSIYDHKNI